MSALDRAIGMRLRLARVSRRIEIGAAARQCGVTPGRVMSWESGASRPYLHQILAIAAIYDGLDVHWLLLGAVPERVAPLARPSAADRRYRLLDGPDGRYLVPIRDGRDFAALAARARRGDTDAEFDLHSRFHGARVADAACLSFTDPHED